MHTLALNLPFSDKSVVEILSLVGMAIFAGLIGVWMGKVKEAAYRRLRNRAVRASRIKPSTAAGHKQIYAMLENVRQRFGAMRVTLVQFHNGDCFSLSNHSWKLSCTHEVVAPGVQNMVLKYQTIPASALIDIVHPLLDPDNITEPGVALHNARELQSASCACGIRGHRILHFDLQKMAVSVAQTLANEAGVAHMFTVNLMDPDRSATFGYVAVQFSEVGEDMIQEVLGSICEICPVAEKIQFYLTTDFKEFAAKRNPWYMSLFPE